MDAPKCKVCQARHYGTCHMPAKAKATPKVKPKGKRKGKP
jgi:hypothetical protein